MIMNIFFLVSIPIMCKFQDENISTAIQQCIADAIHTEPIISCVSFCHSIASVPPSAHKQPSEVSPSNISQSFKQLKLRAF